MNEREVIRKAEPLPHSQDYARLRREGLAHIRRLSGSIWTDHNLHDPGITILEILCYALTDLGYRTGFGMPDLLAHPEGRIDPPQLTGLFPAHEVLPCAPLTATDHRRLLLKIDGVRNAWVIPETTPGDSVTDGEGAQVPPDPNWPEEEVPIYADCLADTLTFDRTNAAGKENPRVRPSGLYRVLLELEVDDRLGSLGEERLVHRVRSGKLKGVVLALGARDPATLAAEVDVRADPQGVSHVISVHSAGEARFEARVTMDFGEGGGEHELPLLDLTVLQARPDPAEDPVEVRAVDLRALLAGSDADDPVLLFWEKQRRRRWIFRAAARVLHAHRNLCEDILSVGAIGPDRIGICADIDVEGEADIEAVLARAFHEVEQYLNPTVPFRSLKELLAEGQTPEEIFDGPLPDPMLELDGKPVFTRAGFVTTSGLEETGLRTMVHTSDIVNRIMDLDGVVAVRNLTLRRYDEAGRALGSEEPWCLAVTPGHQPILEVHRSRVLLFKNEIPYAARPGELVRSLDHLRAMASREAYVETREVLEEPRGRYRNLHKYHSIQHDLPRTYGVGPGGLAASTEPARIAKARQLKAYLTFYDQVLADYLAQLAGVRRLLSLDGELRQSYFSRYLFGMEAPVDAGPDPAPGEDRVEFGIAGVRRAFEDEIYGLRHVLEDDGLRTRLNESEETFLERRNRALDHLAARFAERFTDYVGMMFSLRGDPVHTGHALIDHKIRFLRDAPVLSRDRHRAFDYRAGEPDGIWDSGNVSGLERRVARILGISDHRRRDLHCAGHFEEFFGTRKVGEDFRLEIRGRTGAILFKSDTLFGSRDEALAAAQPLHPFLRDRDAFRIDAAEDTFSFAIAAAGTSLRHDHDFQTEREAVRAIRAVIDRYDEVLLESEACDAEGFHLIEHVLLRPTREGDPLMEVCLAPECGRCGDEDPYSFRATAVLPYWPKRFRHPGFRRLVERTLREEAPAHVHLRVCWVGNPHMELLDRRYREWLEEKAREPVDTSIQRERTEALVEILGQLRTVHPAAALHDCREGEDETVVRLGTTNLGIFQQSGAIRT